MAYDVEHIFTCDLCPNTSRQKESKAARREDAHFRPKDWGRVWIEIDRFGRNSEGYTLCPECYGKVKELLGRKGR